MQEQNTPTSANPKKNPHLRERATWMRMLYMLLFVIAYGIAEFILTGVVILQIILRLFTGKINERLRQFGSDMSQYVYDMLRFLTFNSEEMPFPLSNWKSGEKADSSR